MMYLVLVALLAVLVSVSSVEEGIAALGLSSTASNTYYNSYPQCCPKSPNYDPRASKEECNDYSGCEYMGDMAGFVTDSNPDGHVSFDYVKSHNLVAFYDNSDKSGKNWAKNYKLKKIQITKTYKGKTTTFNATIADTCGNNDCDNCCAKNSDKKTGYLVDIEYYTVMNNFGSIDAGSGGTLSFRIF